MKARAVKDRRIVKGELDSCALLHNKQDEKFLNPNFHNTSWEHHYKRQLIGRLNLTTQRRITDTLSASMEVKISYIRSQFKIWARLETLKGLSTKKISHCYDNTFQQKRRSQIRKPVFRAGGYESYTIYIMPLSKLRIYYNAYKIFLNAHK
ncbi:hypothetical protein QOT17_000066 [Balamuthia mandrillaris]